MWRLSTRIAAVAALTLAAAPVIAQNSHAREEARERPIPLAQVPKPAVHAAKRVLGPNITQARVTHEHGRKVYELESKNASGKEKAVHVAANGKVLKIERATG